MKHYVIAYDLLTVDIDAKSEEAAIEWFESEIQKDWDHIWEEEAAE